MGFRFHKSASFGPLRINFSKSGVGYSVGGKGFRVTKKAGGGVRTTASIPGTGISYVTDHGSKKKSASSPGSGTRSNANSGTFGKKPFYQRPWFVAVVIIVLLSTMGSACSGDDTDQTDDVTSQQEETVLPVEDDTTQEAAQPSETDTPDTPEDAEETPAENNTKSPESATPEEPETPDSALKEQNTSNENSSQQETTSTAAPATPSTSTPVSEPAAQPAPEPEPETHSQEGTYVGSIDSDKYHNPGCRWAKKILPENEIWFESKEAAQAAGYLPCGTCQ